MSRLRRRVAASFDGLSPESAALIVVLGVVFGTFPVYGLPTVLCALASIVFGVNLPAVQVVNQLTTPLQWAMLLPLAKIGARLIGFSHPLPWGWNAGVTVLQAVAGWLIVCVPLGLLSHALIAWALRSPSTRQLFQRPAAVQAR